MRKTKFVYRSFGKSMAPLINPGDLIFINKIEKNFIELGDIVLFVEKNKCLSHRVIGFFDNRLIIKGDNINETDRMLDRREVLGKVVKIKGCYGEIDLNHKAAKYFSLYFIFRSRLLYFTSGRLHRFLSGVLRGRKIIVKNILAH